MVHLRARPVKAAFQTLPRQSQYTAMSFGLGSVPVVLEWLMKGLLHAFLDCSGFCLEGILLYLQGLGSMSP